MELRIILILFQAVILLFRPSFQGATQMRFRKISSCLDFNFTQNILSYTTVAAKSQCAMNCLHSKTCIAYADAEEVSQQSGKVHHCANIFNMLSIPEDAAAECSGTISTAAVFFYTWKANGKDLVCSAGYTAFNQNQCVLNTNKLASGKDEAESMCKSFGGYLPEAETLDNLAVISSVASYGRYLFLGAVDSIPNNKFVWSKSGWEVDSSLWDTSQPESHTKEYCTAVMENGSHLHNVLCTDHSPRFRVVCSFSIG